MDLCSLPQLSETHFLIRVSNYGPYIRPSHSVQTTSRPAIHGGAPPQIGGGTALAARAISGGADGRRLEVVANAAEFERIFLLFQLLFQTIVCLLSDNFYMPVVLFGVS